MTALQAAPEQKMLTDAILAAFNQGVASFKQQMTELANCGNASAPRSALPALFKVSAQDWLAQPELQHEVFGAVGVWCCARMSLS